MSQAANGFSAVAWPLSRVRVLFEDTDWLSSLPTLQSLT